MKIPTTWEHISNWIKAIFSYLEKWITSTFFPTSIESTVLYQCISSIFNFNFFFFSFNSCSILQVNNYILIRIKFVKKKTHLIEVIKEKTAQLPEKKEDKIKDLLYSDGGTIMPFY